MIRRLVVIQQSNNRKQGPCWIIDILATATRRHKKNSTYQHFLDTDTTHNLLSTGYCTFLKILQKISDFTCDIHMPNYIPFSQPSFGTPCTRPCISDKSKINSYFGMRLPPALFIFFLAIKKHLPHTARFHFRAFLFKRSTALPALPPLPIFKICTTYYYEGGSGSKFRTTKPSSNIERGRRSIEDVF